MKSNSGFAKIKSGFSSYSNSLFELTVRVIIASMTGNLYFPNPTPAISDIQDAYDNFLMLMGKAKIGNKNDKRLRDEARRTLNLLIKNLGDFITYTGQGDFEILQSSGYQLAKIPEPNAPIGAPQNFKVGNGINSGTFKLSVKSDKNVKLYGFQYTGDPLTEQSNWQTALYSKSRFTITGLTPGTKYWFRVTASGINGQITYSTVVAQICQ